MKNFNKEEITSVRHWNDTLFSFTTTRDPGFRFKNGHFTMIGLEQQKRPLMRAYSIASANHEEEMEFFSIKVPDGPLTSRLQHLQVGDQILVSRQTYRHVDYRRLTTRQTSLPVKHWNWPGSLYQHNQGPGSL